jgi:cation diffusion facilitator family transporter
LITNRLVQGGKVAQRSFVVQLLVGFVELFVGLFTLSVALIADGVQSFADSGVSLIVWSGLRISKRKPDKRFHFGYHRFETLSSISAAVLMSILGAMMFFVSARELFNPTPITHPSLSMITAIGAAIVSTGLLIYKNRAAKKYNSVALKTDAKNSIKDVLTSITAFVGIALNEYFNLIHTDALAGIIISIFVFTMVYPIIREASLVLVDACENPEIIKDIAETAKKTGQIKRVDSIRIRKTGSYMMGDIAIAVDGNLTVNEAAKIKQELEANIKKEFPDIIEIKVMANPE